MENKNKMISFKCPCCNNLISINLDSCEISTVFFNTQKQKELAEKLSNLGYEFGMNGGDLDG